MKFTLERADDGKHKWVGVFTDDDGKETRTKFGAKGYSDFTQHGDRLRRESYLKRHRTSENWSDYKSAGSLARWILWDSTSLQQNLASFRRRFSLS